jgi:hypothetical protein
MNLRVTISKLKEHVEDVTRRIFGPKRKKKAEDKKN